MENVKGDTPLRRPPWRGPCRKMSPRGNYRVAIVTDDALAERIRPLLADRDGYSERRMFGGVCFMIGGNMCVGTWKEALIVRIDRKERDSVLAMPHTRPADMNGRVMKGWALVEPAGIRSDRDLESWVDRAAAYAASLPAK